MRRNYIIRFDGTYRFLSNFYPYEGNGYTVPFSEPISVAYDEVLYSTSEHAYQAAKTLDLEERKVVQAATTAGRAKKEGQRVTLREDWESIKDRAMWEIICSKFELNFDMKNKLLATDTAILVEGNRWHDCYWGVCWCDVCMGKGENRLGQLLMRLRKQIKE